MKASHKWFLKAVVANLISQEVMHAYNQHFFWADSFGLAYWHVVEWPYLKLTLLKYGFASPPPNMFSQSHGAWKGSPNRNGPPLPPWGLGPSAEGPGGGGQGRRETGAPIHRLGLYIGVETHKIARQTPRMLHKSRNYHVLSRAPTCYTKKP